MKTPRVDRFDPKHKVKPEPVNFAGVPTMAQKPVHPPVEPLREDTLAVEREGRKEVSKFTRKLESRPGDQPVNKVGYYFTRKEIDQLDTLYLKLKPILRDRYNKRISRNEIIRACLLIGLSDWEANQLTSELVYLLTGK
jgi:hypothetical protein